MSSVAAALRRGIALFRADDGPPRARDAWLIGALALAVRAVVVAYAAARFPPADDGTFYHAVAGRIARGLGYTWAWPDGAVTYAAHYPVGYPALLAVGYALLGARPAVAMGLNALLGAAGAVASWSLSGRLANRRGAALAGLLVALEPALVLYTPALMTEAVAGELVVVAAALASAAWPGVRWRACIAGLVLGLALLVRPQLALAAPFVGALLVWRAPRVRSVGLAALAVTALAVGVCLPWTLRNCERLGTCAFVSANGGWNLYIGSSPLGHGGWAPLEQIGVPPACRTVFAEGDKDRCFGRAGLQAIARAPLTWLSLAPEKLGVTFNYGTAAAHYLATANPTLVTDARKTAIGAAELFGQRVLLLAALFGIGLAPGARPVLRSRLAWVGALLALAPFAWLAWGVLVVQGVLCGRSLWRLPSVVLAVGLVLSTALTHAVFFGAGRYALVCLPALAALAGLLATKPAASSAGVRN